MITLLTISHFSFTGESARVPATAGELFGFGAAAMLLFNTGLFGRLAILAHGAFFRFALVILGFTGRAGHFIGWRGKTLGKILRGLSLSSLGRQERTQDECLWKRAYQTFVNLFLPRLRVAYPCS